MDTPINFNDMLDPALLLTADQAKELQNSVDAEVLKSFSLLTLTHTPKQILGNLMAVDDATARESLAEGMRLVNAYIDCAEAHLTLARLARARLLIAAGAYQERRQSSASVGESPDEG
ncbi:hypothetical protein [Neopusillimonas maritima]|uniref:Phasin domain-containing protein n=1 Tax=Neopusillimonas maritima TaxID=2026239 RepID=A0ABX9MZG2_9BURK|nr:hypothetical protein [Neopusillimonas maritima]RII84357.1 hypothetical protein CJO09_03860 [Neopusillimonas maritima]